MILILGGGFVGTHLYGSLKDRFFNIKLLKRSELDYSNEKIFRDFLLKEKPEYIINCSGYTGYPNVDACEDNKQDCIFYNFQTPIHVQLLCRELNIKHIYVSSGCIYTGYEKDFTEDDIPNFGIFSNESSYYSKSKHLFELATQDLRDNLAILRIRMPFTHTLEHKNYLTKIYSYDNLINQLNSLTFLEDLNKFIFYLTQANNFKGGIYNIVNTEPLYAYDIVQLFRDNNINNPSWKIIELNELKTKANRSNCVLSNKKVTDLGFVFSDTRKAVDLCIKNMKILLGFNNV